MKPAIYLSENSSNVNNNNNLFGILEPNNDDILLSLENKSLQDNNIKYLRINDSHNLPKKILIDNDNNDNTIINNKTISDNSTSKVKRINNNDFIDNQISKKNLRKDIFGRIIQKKGSHKISFADDLEMFKNRMGCKYRYSEDNQTYVQALELIIKERKEKKVKN